MATLNANVYSLIDVTKMKDPDGKFAKIGEILNQDNDLVGDIPWKEGNLTTGERITVRNSLPSVGFRRLNEGVARSKTTNRQFDEGAALLEANSQIDRKLAILGGDPAATRANDDKAFIEAMSQRMATTVIYGNSLTAEKEFTGLTPRYNSLSGPNANQIIDAGGIGTDNSSIWLVGWGLDSVYGIYPMNTVAGLMHMDTTSNLRPGPDGFPIGDEVLDANNNPYLAYKSHYEWNCGFAVRDARYIVRIANIDKSLMTKDFSTGADLADLMEQALGKMKKLTPNTAFYTTRSMQTFMLRQSRYEKRAFFDRTKAGVGGGEMPTFSGIVVNRVDAMIADEARVT